MLCFSPDSTPCGKGNTPHPSAPRLLTGTRLLSEDLRILVKFSLAAVECLTLTPSLGMIPCEYHQKCYIARNYIIWASILLHKVSVYLQPHLRNGLLKSTKFSEITQTTRQLRRSRSFNVTAFGTSRKLVWDFLLVINTNLLPILHSFQVTVDYWSNVRYRHGTASL